MASSADLAGDVTIGVASSADLAGDVTIGVESSADFAEFINLSVASSADLAGDVTAGVTSLANLAEVVTAGVASSAHYDGDATTGVTSMEECEKCDVVRPRAVKPIFTFSDWTMRHCPPAVKCKLDSPWLSLYMFVSLCGWAVGVKLQPDSAVLFVHYQALEKIPQPRSLVSSLPAPGRPELGPITVNGSALCYAPLGPSLPQLFSVTLFYAEPVRLVLINQAFDYRGATECVPVLQCAIIVLLSEIKQATPCPSLTCARTILDADCTPAPLRDTAGCSPDDIALVTCPDLPETYPACGFNRRCPPGFAHHPSDLMALAIKLSAHRGFCVSFDKPLSQPASSDSGELITECFLIDVSDTAWCTEGQLVRPEALLLLSCRVGDGGRLLPATHAWILTGGPMTCDWLRPVTREVWLVAPPINVEVHTAVSYFGCSGLVTCTGITCYNRRSVDILLLTWTHGLLIILCCLTDLCFCLLWTCRTTPDCVLVLPGWLDQSIRDFQHGCSRICIFMVYILCCVMAFGDDQPAGDRSAATFQCEYV